MYKLSPISLLIKYFILSQYQAKMCTGNISVNMKCQIKLYSDKDVTLKNTFGLSQDLI